MESHPCSSRAKCVKNLNAFRKWPPRGALGSYDRHQRAFRGRPSGQERSGEAIVPPSSSWPRAKGDLPETPNKRLWGLNEMLVAGVALSPFLRQEALGQNGGRWCLPGLGGGRRTLSPGRCWTQVREAIAASSHLEPFRGQFLSGNGKGKRIFRNPPLCLPAR